MQFWRENRERKIGFVALWLSRAAQLMIGLATPHVTCYITGRWLPWDWKYGSQEGHCLLFANAKYSQLVKKNIIGIILCIF